MQTFQSIQPFLFLFRYCMYACIYISDKQKYIHLNIQHYLSSLIAWEHIPDTREFITQSADLLATWMRL